MLSLIRMPFVAATLLFSSTSLTGGFTGKGDHNSFSTIISAGKKISNTVSEKYASWQLDKQGISIDLFAYAIKGYEYLNQLNRIANKEFITIIDFSKPSSEKRLFVINTATGNVVFKTLVAHGRNSGKEWAKAFSNTASSFASSLGFYTTSEVYNGKHGISLRLNGCEKGFNDNAYKRAVVMHGADYVSEHFLEQNGYLGRSHGCPAVPTNVSKKIIETIKDGSCLFIYAPSKQYLSLSAIINS
jgi:L,D-transpeptidase catalytic domain